MELYAQFHGNHFGLCLRMAGFVVRNHEHALTVKTIPAQQCRGGRTVNSPAKRNKNLIFVTDHFLHKLTPEHSDCSAAGCQL
jgi:hypothetical protein